MRVRSPLKTTLYQLRYLLLATRHLVKSSLLFPIQNQIHKDYTNHVHQSLSGGIYI